MSLNSCKICGKPTYNLGGCNDCFKRGQNIVNRPSTPEEIRRREEYFSGRENRTNLNEVVDKHSGTIQRVDTENSIKSLNEVIKK